MCCIFLHLKVAVLTINLIFLPLYVTTECESHRTKSSLYLSTKTPYRLVQNESRSPYNVPPECKAHQVWMLIRHGTRYPSSWVIIKMNEHLPDLRNEIIKSHSQGIGKLCSEELERFENWSAQVEPSEEKRLAHEGEEEMADLAERMLDRLPGLLEENYANHSYKFRYTATQRTGKSARHFADGLFGRRKSRYVWYPEALSKDPILRFYKLCSKWQTEVDDNPTASMQERRLFERTPLYSAVRQSVAERLGLPSLTPGDLRLVYTTCAFESAWSRRAESPWCAAFSERELQVLEYAEDLEYYWTDGYGFDVNHQQACPPVQHMLESFQQAASGGASPRGVFHFSHSGALLKVLAHLGLFRDDEPLRHSTFEKHRQAREWRTGRIDSFGANLAAVLYRCGDGGLADHRVLLLHQERPVTVPGCPPSGLCPLERLLRRFPDCNFHHVCGVPHQDL